MARWGGSWHRRTYIDIALLYRLMHLAQHGDTEDDNMKCNVQHARVGYMGGQTTWEGEAKRAKIRYSVRHGK